MNTSDLAPLVGAVLRDRVVHDLLEENGKLKKRNAELEPRVAVHEGENPLFMFKFVRKGSGDHLLLNEHAFLMEEYNGLDRTDHKNFELSELAMTVDQMLVTELHINSNVIVRLRDFEISNVEYYAGGRTNDTTNVEVGLCLEFGNADIQFYCVLAMSVEYIAEMDGSDDVNDVVKKFEMDTFNFYHVDIQRLKVEQALRKFGGKTIHFFNASSDHFGDGPSFSISRDYLESKCRFR
jgi:hypothetical protein